MRGGLLVGVLDAGFEAGGGVVGMDGVRLGQRVQRVCEGAGLVHPAFAVSSPVLACASCIFSACICWPGLLLGLLVLLDHVQERALVLDGRELDQLGRRDTCCW